MPDTDSTERERARETESEREREREVGGWEGGREGEGGNEREGGRESAFGREGGREGERDHRHSFIICVCVCVCTEVTCLSIVAGCVYRCGREACWQSSKEGGVSHHQRREVCHIIKDGRCVTL